MKTISLHNEQLLKVFNRYKVPTMDQLKKGLGSTSTMTVFRKLKELDYFSSCSHSGKYYALKTTPQFNDLGLWFHKSILFSLHGTLAETIKTLIGKSEKGYTALELENLLKIKPNEVLLKLIMNGFAVRDKIAGKYVYFSICEKVEIKQKLFRKNSDSKTTTSNVLMNKINASIIIFYCTLNEKQRRLYAGLESMKLGTGGDKIMSELLSLNIKTVAKGKKELLNNSINIDTIRGSGGGRKKKKIKSQI